MTQVIDASVNVAKAVTDLKAVGIKTIIRYYNRDDTPKVIRQAEFNAILAAGLNLCIVHQRGGRDPAEYTPQSAVLDCAHVRSYGLKLGQPAGSAIYFAVDFDISRAGLNANVIPYFKALKTEMAKATGAPIFRIGVYGSGLTCKTLLDAGLVDFTWLSQSRKFTGTPEFTASNRWNLLQLMPSTLANVSVDADVIGTVSSDFGQFNAARSGQSLIAETGARFRTTARNGLRLRSGPGTNFPVLDSLDFGTIIREVRREEPWSFVDLQGDGKIDGAVSTGFLEAVS